MRYSHKSSSLGYYPIQYSVSSVPTRTDLSVQVKSVFVRIFVRGFSKIRIFGLLYGFFFLKRPFLKVLLINSALLQIV